MTFIWFSIAALSMDSDHTAISTIDLSVLIGGLLREILSEVLTTMLIPYTLCTGRLYYTVYRSLCQLALLDFEC